MKESIIHALRLAQKNASVLYEAGLPEGCTVTIRQAEVLLTLMRNGPSTQTAICNFTTIDRSTLATMLAPLARDKMIVSVVHEGDQRANMVSITPKGRAALCDAMEAFDRAERMIAMHIPGGKRKFLAVLKSIAEAV